MPHTKCSQLTKNAVNLTLLLCGVFGRGTRGVLGVSGSVGGWGGGIGR